MSQSEKKRDYLKMEKEGTTLEEGRKAGIYRRNLKGASKEEIQALAKKSTKKTKLSKKKKQSIIDRIAQAIKDIFD